MSDKTESFPNRGYIPKIRPEAQKAADDELNRASDLIKKMLGASVINEEMLPIINPDFVDEDLLDKNMIDPTPKIARYNQSLDLDVVPEQDDSTATPSA